jgi:hypothetical protein
VLHSHFLEHFGDALKALLILDRDDHLSISEVFNLIRWNISALGDLGLKFFPALESFDRDMLKIFLKKI